MNTQKKKVDTQKHMRIMGILSLIFSLTTAAPIELIFILGIVPLICSIIFLIKKHPVPGIICTVFFFMNRIETFTEGTALSTIIILGITAYFIYVNYLSIQLWKEKQGQ